MKHFNCLHPPEFISNGTMIEAGEWIRNITKIINTMGITHDEDLVRLASFQLRSNADEWWEAQTRTRRPETFT